MCLLVGHVVVSGRNESTLRFAVSSHHFIGEVMHVKRRCVPFKIHCSLQLIRVTVKFKLLIVTIRRKIGYAVPRFISSFRMTDSAISFMDFRICWLCFCIAR